MAIFNFTAVDWVILAVIVYSVTISIMRGFIHEAIRLGAVVMGLLLAAWLHRSVAPLFKEVVKTENLALFFGFSVIFLATLLAGVFVIWLVTRLKKFAKLEWADRVLGAAFGFIRGWVISAVILLGLTAFDVQTDRVRNSELAPYFLPGSRVIALLTPYELKARFLVGYRSIERWWREQ